MPKIPYGEFKGKEIEDCPDWFVKWAAESWKEDTEENKAICLAADKEWTLRESNK